MSRVIIGTLFLVAASSFISAQEKQERPKLYTFLVADTETEDKGAKKAYKANLRNLNKLVAEIKRADFMNVEEPVVVEGSRFNCRTIAAALSRHRAKMKTNDAVLFHYSGPGFQTSGKLPEFDCRRAWEDTNRVGLASVAELFKGRPRLVVAMADTGNKRKSNRLGEMDVRYRYQLAPDRGPTEALARKQQVLRALFMEGKGVYKVTAAKRGEDASFLVGDDGDAEPEGCQRRKESGNKKQKREDDDGNEDEKYLGGAFTYYFLQALENVQDVRNVTWDKVLIEATRPIYLPESRPTQTPYCER
jgi:hypothetical protein